MGIAWNDLLFVVQFPFVDGYVVYCCIRSNQLVYTMKAPETLIFGATRTLYNPGRKGPPR